MSAKFALTPKDTGAHAAATASYCTYKYINDYSLGTCSIIYIYTHGQEDTTQRHRGGGVISEENIRKQRGKTTTVHEISTHMRVPMYIHASYCINSNFNGTKFCKWPFGRLICGFIFANGHLVIYNSYVK